MVQENGEEYDALKAYLKSVNDEFDKEFSKKEAEDDDTDIEIIETNHKNIRNDKNVPKVAKDDISRLPKHINVNGEIRQLSYSAYESNKNHKLPDFSEKSQGIKMYQDIIIPPLVKRPRKTLVTPPNHSNEGTQINFASNENKLVPKVKRGRGRPKKIKTESVPKVKRGRGRPKKGKTDPGQIVVLGPAHLEPIIYVHASQKTSQKEKCDTCGKKFYETSYLKKHIQTDHGLLLHQKANALEVPKMSQEARGPLVTQLPEKVSQNSSQLENCHKCDACGKNFPEAIDLIHHIQTDHGLLYQKASALEVSEISQKQKVLSKVSPAMSEESEVSQEYKCDSCNKTFSQACNLKMHIKTHHHGFVNEDKIANVSEPSLLSLISQILQIKSQVAQQEYKCNSCQKIFFQTSDLNNHIKALHEHESSITKKSTPISKDTAFNCKKCEKSFSCQIELKKHNVNIHYKHAKRITCTFCQKSFCGQLIKSLKCDFCDQTFEFQCRLKSHAQTVHNITHPFKCDFCEKSYGSYGSVRKHKSLVHISKKIHQCDLCKKQFNQSYNLNLHLKTHGMGKHLEKYRYFSSRKCKICGKNFTGLSGLKGHISDVHPLAILQE